MSGPAQARPRGTWTGAAGLFVAGGVGAVALLALVLGLAGAHQADVAVLVFAAGVFGGVRGMLWLPPRHRAGLVLGAVLTPAALFGYAVYVLLTTPWSF